MSSSSKKQIVCSVSKTLWLLAVLLLLSLGQTSVFAGQPEITRVVLSNPPRIVAARPTQLAQAGPDPFDLLVSSAASFDIDSPVEAHAEFDPPVANVGERVVYRVVVSALDESLTLPDELPIPKGLELKKGGRGQTYQRTGGMKLRPQTTAIYHVTVTNIGDFTIPGYDLTAYGRPVKVPAATLKVVAAGEPAGSEPPRLLMDLPGDCYVGQLLRIPVIMPMGPGGAIGGLLQPRVTGEFIFSEQVPAGMRIENLQRDGKSYMACIEELFITPLRAGSQPLIAQVHTGVQRPNPKQTNLMERFDFLVDSDPLPLNVKPLPTEGVLPGFTGAVGSFQAEPPMLSADSVRAGEPVTLTVRIHGDGNLGRLVPPRVPPLREWQSFPPVSDNGSSSVALQRGFASFQYTLIPLTDKITETPVIPFSFFDPVQKKYASVDIPSVPIKVMPGAPGFASHLPPLEKPPPNPEQSEEKEPVFTGLVSKPGLAAATMTPLQQRWWFALIQLLPAAVIGGIWAWDRRRRYLEMHPEVILKRRARRGLRRQLQLARRAAASRDAAGFVTGAANALREACAPHSAAHPAALVCGDVLQELPPSQREGRAAEAIRRLFNAADALRFGGAVKESSELLALQPDVERLLAELKLRLE